MRIEQILPPRSGHELHTDRQTGVVPHEWQADRRLTRDVELGRVLEHLAQVRPGLRAGEVADRGRRVLRSSG